MLTHDSRVRPEPDFDDYEGSKLNVLDISIEGEWTMVKLERHLEDIDHQVIRLIPLCLDIPGNAGVCVSSSPWIILSRLLLLCFPPGPS